MTNIRVTSLEQLSIEIINNKARHNLMDAKCRWRSDRLDGTVSFKELFGQTKVMQIHQGETLNHQGAITHEVCCLAAQLQMFVIHDIFATSPQC